MARALFLLLAVLVAARALPLADNDDDGDDDDPLLAASEDDEHRSFDDGGFLAPGSDDTTTAASTSPTTVASMSSGTNESVRGAERAPVDAFGVLTRWGHDDEIRGVERLGDVARVDLLRELRDHTLSGGCRRAVDDVLEARDRLQLRGLRVHSASVTLPDALLAGRIYDLGDFDGCLSVPSAMYCLLDVVVDPAASTGPTTAHPGDELSPYEPPRGANATLWDALKISGNRRRYRRDHMQWALCLPAECGHPGHPGHPGQQGQLDSAVSGALRGVGKSLGVDLLVRLRPSDCYRAAQDNDSHPLGPAFLAGSIFILSFPALTLIASLRRRYLRTAHSGESAEGQQGTLSRAIDCFAAQTNWTKLGRRKNTQIHNLQGLRTITLALIVLGHRVMFTFSGPLQNPEYVEESFNSVSRMLIVNGSVVVATFFVITGFLESRLALTHVGKMRRFHLGVVFQHYLARYFRLAPALGVMLAIEVFWVELMGSGPVWNQVVGKSVADCKDNWWSHLLFINNYYDPESRCLGHTWFLASMLQLYLATPFIMWLVGRWTLCALWPGCLLLGLLLVGASAAHVATTLAWDLHPMLHLYPELLRQLKLYNDPTFKRQYIATHTNAVPYVVGLIAGTLLFLVQRKKWQPSTRVARLMWFGILLGGLLQLASIMTGVVFFLPSFRPRPLLDATYGPARFLAFCVPVGWVIFTCSIGVGGAVNSLLTWTPMLALGRLTYCAYLVHMTVIGVTVGLTRQPTILSTYAMLHLIVADFMLSYAIGLLLHLCVEAPMDNLMAMLFAKSIAKVGLTPIVQGRDVQCTNPNPESTPPPPRNGTSGTSRTRGTRGTSLDAWGLRSPPGSGCTSSEL